MLGHGARRFRSGVWHAREKSRNLVHPTMLQKAKRVTGFLVEMAEKAGPLNAMAYMILRGGWSPKKRGVPKNAGTSDDMYENKGQKNSDRGHPTMFMKTSNLTVLSDDVDENKQLNTRSALAQRAMLSGFIVCSPPSLSSTNIAEFHSAVARIGEPVPESRQPTTDKNACPARANRGGC